MFYIFHGQDEHSKKEYLTNRLSKLGDPAMLELNTTRFEGAITISQLRQACDSLPFLAPKRIIIAKELFASKPTKEFMQDLLGYLPNLPDFSNLVFLENQELRESHPIIRLAREVDNGFEKKFPMLEGPKIDRWIQKRVEKMNGRINPQAARLLAANVGNDLQILENELEKLVAYKGSEVDGIIEPDDVLLLSPYAAEANIFDLVDALGNRNGRRAAELLQMKINEGVDPFQLFAMFIRQFRLLIQVKELADSGYRPQVISQELKLHSFVTGKLFQQARGFNMAELEQIYEHFLTTDVEVKTGRCDLQTALYLFVANLTIVT